jgi:hypothetical protein
MGTRSALDRCAKIGDTYLGGEMIRRRTEAQWAEKLLGRAFEANDGEDMPRFTLTGYDPESGECRVHKHNALRERVSFPFSVLVAAYREGLVIEATEAPVCWSKGQ